MSERDGGSGDGGEAAGERDDSEEPAGEGGGGGDNTTDRDDGGEEETVESAGGDTSEDVAYTLHAVAPVVLPDGSIDLIVKSFANEEDLHEFILDNTHIAGMKIFRGEEYRFELKTERTIIKL